jgi:NAD(P)-dependent dehydrogenase (short-subunit alcohol dehydrogenase family)
MTEARGLFDLTGRVVVITGGAGLLGPQHGEAVARFGGVPVLADLREEEARERAGEISSRWQVPALGVGADVTRPGEVERLRDQVLERFGRIDVLINNAANNPKAEAGSQELSRLESFSVERWNADLAVGLTGAFLCAQVLGIEMARRGRGVILNIASDLAVIAPDQRIYRRDGLAEEAQPVKPVSYSVVKTGLLGLTRYLATYWADRGVRVNALSPGGVQTTQDAGFLARLEQRIPLARMAEMNEYQGAVVFLCSDASSYMTGANLVVDGGRTCW